MLPSNINPVRLQLLVVMALPEIHVVALVAAPHMAEGPTMLAEATVVEATMVEVAPTRTLAHALLLPLLHMVQMLNPLVAALSTMWVRLQVPNHIML